MRYKLLGRSRLRVSEVCRGTMTFGEDWGWGGSKDEVAINWVRQQRGAPIIPILGARTAAQLRDNLGCPEFELIAEQIARLADASPLDLGFPHYFLALPHLRGLIYSGMLERIDIDRS